MLLDYVARQGYPLGAREDPAVRDSASVSAASKLPAASHAQQKTSALRAQEGITDAPHLQPTPTLTPIKDLRW